MGRFTTKRLLSIGCQWCGLIIKPPIDFSLFLKRGTDSLIDVFEKAKSAVQPKHDLTNKLLKI